MGRISFQKRQKEMKRQEKQQLKAQKRAERKLAKNAEAQPAPQQLASERQTQVSSIDLPAAADNLADLLNRSKV